MKKMDIKPHINLPLKRKSHFGIIEKYSDFENCDKNIDYTLICLTIFLIIYFTSLIMNQFLIFYIITVYFVLITTDILVNLLKAKCENAIYWFSKLDDY